MSQKSFPSRRRFIGAVGGGFLLAGPKPPVAEGSQKMKHVVLLGDSIFANAAYVAGGPDVAAQLRRTLPADWRVSLLAVDGAVIANVPGQLARMPNESSHLVISIGGNDALGYSGVLGAAARSVAEALEQLAMLQERFHADYREMLKTVLQRNLPVAVCTIYNPRYPDPVQRGVARTALCVINDVIIREAASYRVPIIDLRTVCSDDAHFANAIEPSSRGGERIAAAITSLIIRPANRVASEIVA